MSGNFRRTNAECPIPGCVRSLPKWRQRFFCPRSYDTYIYVYIYYMLAPIEGVSCKCKNCRCLKKYCECVCAGVKCTDRCDCVDCENGKVEARGAPAAKQTSSMPLVGSESSKKDGANTIVDESKTGGKRKRVNNACGKDGMKRTHYVRTRAKRGKYRSKLQQAMRLKDEAIQRCKDFIMKQNQELERVKSLLQRFLDRENSLVSYSQLTATQDSNVTEDIASDVGSGDEEEGKGGKGGGGGPEGRDEGGFSQLILTSQLSEISDLGDGTALNDIMHIIDRVDNNENALDDDDGEDASKLDEGNSLEYIMDDEEEDGGKESFRLRSFLNASPEGRRLLVAFDATEK